MPSPGVWVPFICLRLCVFGLLTGSEFLRSSPGLQGDQYHLGVPTDMHARARIGRAGEQTGVRRRVRTCEPPIEAFSKFQMDCMAWEGGVH